MAYTVLAIVLAAVFRPYEDSRANGFYIGSLVGDAVIYLFAAPLSNSVVRAQVAILAMMLICLGGRDASGEWSGFHRDRPAFTGVLLCLCTIGIPAAGMHKHGRYCHFPEPTSDSAYGISLLQL